VFFLNHRGPSTVFFSRPAPATLRPGQVRPSSGLARAGFAPSPPLALASGNAADAIGQTLTSAVPPLARKIVKFFTNSVPLMQGISRSRNAQCQMPSAKCPVPNARWQMADGGTSSVISHLSFRISHLAFVIRSPVESARPRDSLARFPGRVRLPNGSRPRWRRRCRPGWSRRGTRS